MQDTQSFLDERKIIIAKVGIKDIYHPILFLDEEDNSQYLPTTAKFSFFVELQAERKGTHMSRFPLLLYEYSPNFSVKKFKEMAKEINPRLGASVSYLDICFRFFYEKKAPVSQIAGLMDSLISIQIKSVNHLIAETKLTIKVPVTSLCPCSKAISKFGAHSQRSHIQLSIWDPASSLQEYIKIVEDSASAPVYPVLKRNDEKYVTEQAYENPKFVEDLVREIAIKIKGQSRFEVSAENFESIHNHSAWALVRSKDILKNE